MTQHPPADRGAECAIPPDEVQRRTGALGDALSRAGLDAFVATSPEDIFYLSGQQSPGYYSFQCLVVARSGDHVLLVRELERMNAFVNTRSGEIAIYSDGDDPIGKLGELLAARGIDARRAALDRTGWFPSPAVVSRLEATLGPLADGAGLVGRLRLVKSPFEIDCLAQAASFVDAGVSAAVEAAAPGVSENAIAAAILAALVEAGSEYLAMEPLVAAGHLAGVPHATWRRRTIPADSAILLGVAASHSRYHAALQRTLAVGALPKEAARMWAACNEALDAAIAAIRPGVACADVHEACQSVITRHGYEPNFRKRAGYSIGLAFAPDWGEGHLLSMHAGEKRPLEAGMTFHVAPACRQFGETGAGVSETLVVTDDGCRRLSSLPRDLGGLQ